MPDLMSFAVAALKADQTRIDQISLNAANAATIGFRRSVIVSTDFNQALTQAQDQAADVGANGTSTTTALFPLQMSAVDTTPGALNLTHRTLDVAIEGDGYFTLADGDKTYLTRAGALQVSADGYLVGPKGLRVQGQQGDIRLSSQQGLSIDAQGRITANGQEVATLKLSSIAAEAHLSSADGLVLSSSDDTYIDATPGKATVRSGFLEASNATGIQEMLGLTQQVRHFEGVIRLVQGYDDALGRAIQKLGDI